MNREISSTLSLNNNEIAITEMAITSCFRKLERSSKKKLMELETRARVCFSCLSLYHNCDSTTIRLRHDYDEKLLTCSIFCSRRMEAGARDMS